MYAANTLPLITADFEQNTFRLRHSYGAAHSNSIYTTHARIPSEHARTRRYRAYIHIMQLGAALLMQSVS